MYITLQDLLLLLQVLTSIISLIIAIYKAKK